MTKIRIETKNTKIEIDESDEVIHRNSTIDVVSIGIGIFFGVLTLSYFLLMIIACLPTGWSMIFVR